MASPTKPKTYRADAALIGHDVVPNVLIDIAAGRIARVEADAPHVSHEERLPGLVLPGMANVHSHAFQRAMAGLAEWDASAHDNFWTWREAMYRFAARLTPETQRAVAAFLYVEMLKAGYTAVGEFHYLHNRPDGTAYAPPGAMADATVEAARAAGMTLTMLPVLYMTGGVDGRPLKGGQLRFGNTVDSFLKLVDAAPEPKGVALHSLRAVPVAAIREVLAAVKTGPVHIHAAEQIGEIEEALTGFGRRPVEFLIETFGVDERWCLVHATHLSESEIRQLAKSGAVAGLCPTTEGNLGDGIFPLSPYLDAGGRFGIGGDSHVGVDPAQELRLMEYAQRLTQRRRNVTASARVPHTGARLWSDAARGGAQSLGLDAGVIAVGKRADLVVIDRNHPSLVARDAPEVLDSYVFVAAREAVRDVMVGGEWVVRERRHALDETVDRDWRSALGELARS